MLKTLVELCLTISGVQLKFYHDLVPFFTRDKILFSVQCMEHYDPFVKSPKFSELFGFLSSTFNSLLRIYQLLVIICTFFTLFGFAIEGQYFKKYHCDRAL